MHIDIHPHAAQDLDRLWDNDPKAAAAIQAILEQLEADPNLIDKLTTYGNVPVGRGLINVKPWSSVGRESSLWRFRALDTPGTNYRVGYGYSWRTRQICVLAIATKKEFDYDNHESDFARRILADWRAIF